MLTETLKDTLRLIYPRICPGCGLDIFNSSLLICSSCRDELPHTGFAAFPDNPAERVFAGRLDLCAAHSEFYFSKHQVIQHLIHDLKYKGNKDAGLLLGRLLGESLMASERFRDIDLLLPMPLFAKREHERGYNQSLIICEGISEIMRVPVNSTAVIRQRQTETQTKKQREGRWDNVQNSFHVKAADQLMQRHVLLVDDVMTTGATLEACGRALQKSASIRLSIATVAMATG